MSATKTTLASAADLLDQAAPDVVTRAMELAKDGLTFTTPASLGALLAWAAANPTLATELATKLSR